MHAALLLISSVFPPHTLYAWAPGVGGHHQSPEIYEGCQVSETRNKGCLVSVSYLHLAPVSLLMPSSYQHISSMVRKGGEGMNG